jgi:hypothetical protein
MDLQLRLLRDVPPTYNSSLRHSSSDPPIIDGSPGHGCRHIDHEIEGARGGMSRRSTALGKHKSLSGRLSGDGKQRVVTFAEDSTRQATCAAHSKGKDIEGDNGKGRASTGGGNLKLAPLIVPTAEPDTRPRRSSSFGSLHEAVVEAPEGDVEVEFPLQVDHLFTEIQFAEVYVRDWGVVKRHFSARLSSFSLGVDAVDRDDGSNDVEDAYKDLDLSSLLEDKGKINGKGKNKGRDKKAKGKGGGGFDDLSEPATVEDIASLFDPLYKLAHASRVEISLTEDGDVAGKSESFLKTGILEPYQRNVTQPPPQPSAVDSATASGTSKSNETDSKIGDASKSVKAPPPSAVVEEVVVVGKERRRATLDGTRTAPPRRSSRRDLAETRRRTTDHCYQRSVRHTMGDLVGVEAVTIPSLGFSLSPSKLPIGMTLREPIRWDPELHGYRPLLKDFAANHEALTPPSSALPASYHDRGLLTKSATILQTLAPLQPTGPALQRLDSTGSATSTVFGSGGNSDAGEDGLNKDQTSFGNKIWGLRIVDMRLLWTIHIRDKAFTYVIRYFDFFQYDEIDGMQPKRLSSTAADADMAEEEGPTSLKGEGGSGGNSSKGKVAADTAEYSDDASRESGADENQANSKGDINATGLKKSSDALTFGTTSASTSATASAAAGNSLTLESIAAVKSPEKKRQDELERQRAKRKQVPAADAKAALSDFLQWEEFDEDARRRHGHGHGLGHRAAGNRKESASGSGASSGFRTPPGPGKRLGHLRQSPQPESALKASFLDGVAAAPRVSRRSRIRSTSDAASSLHRPLKAAERKVAPSSAGGPKPSRPLQGPISLHPQHQLELDSSVDGGESSSARELANLQADNDDADEKPTYHMPTTGSVANEGKSACDAHTLTTADDAHPAQRADAPPSPSPSSPSPTKGTGTGLGAALRGLGTMLRRGSRGSPSEGSATTSKPNSPQKQATNSLTNVPFASDSHSPPLTPPLSPGKQRSASPTRSGIGESRSHQEQEGSGDLMSLLQTAPPATMAASNHRLTFGSGAETNSQTHSSSSSSGAAFTSLAAAEMRSRSEGAEGGREADRRRTQSMPPLMRMRPVKTRSKSRRRSSGGAGAGGGSGSSSTGIGGYGLGGDGPKRGRGSTSRRYFLVELVDPQLNFLDTKTHGSVIMVTGRASLEGRRETVAVMAPARAGAVVGNGRQPPDRRQLSDPKRMNEITLRMTAVSAFTVPTISSSSSSSAADENAVIDEVHWKAMDFTVGARGLYSHIHSHIHSHHAHSNSNGYDYDSRRDVLSLLSNANASSSQRQSSRNVSGSMSGGDRRSVDRPDRPGLSLRESGFGEYKESPNLRVAVRDFETRSKYCFWMDVTVKEANCMRVAKMEDELVCSFLMDLPELCLDITSQQFYIIINVVRNVLLAPPPSFADELSTAVAGLRGGAGGGAGTGTGTDTLSSTAAGAAASREEEEAASKVVEIPRDAELRLVSGALNLKQRQSREEVKLLIENHAARPRSGSRQGLAQGGADMARVVELFIGKGTWILRAAEGSGGSNSSSSASGNSESSGSHHSRCPSTDTGNATRSDRDKDKDRDRDGRGRGKEGEESGSGSSSREMLETGFTGIYATFAYHEDR